MSRQRIRERCSCGASIDCSGSTALTVVAAWREDHRHATPRVGICGALQRGIATGRDRQAVCTLLAGHPGWHADGTGLSWGEPRAGGGARSSQLPTSGASQEAPR